jgi:uncharacterized protein
MVAGQRPPHLKAIISGAPPSRLYEDVFYPGGIFNLGQSALWTFGGQPATAARGVAHREAAGDRECALLRASQRPNRMVHEHAGHPLYDEWWRSRSIELDADRLEVPVLLVHAWQDEQIAVSSGLQLFRRIRSPKRIVLSNGGHRFYNQQRLQDLKQRWFDRWLRGRPNGVDTERAVTVFFDNRSDDAGRQAGWTDTFSDWPVSSARTLSLTLLADGRLEADTVAEPGERSYTYPVGTELVGSQAAFAIPPHPQGVVRYQTDPLPEDLMLLGAPVLTLHLSSEQTDTDLMAVLYDLSPDGHITYVQRGFLRASHRGLTASPLAGEFFHDHSTIRRLRPGAVHEIVVPFYAVGHVIRRGHRLVLAVLAPPAVPSPNWSFAVAMQPSRNTIHHSAQFASRLTLQVVPGGARSEAPPCGALEFQPCRPDR